MSDSDSRRDSAFDTDEDNNPFPNGGLASLIQSRNETKGSLQNNHTSRNKSLSWMPPTSSESGSNSLPEEDTSDEEGGSLLLYQGEDTHTVHIDHETRVSRLLAPGRNVYIIINEAGKSNEGSESSSKKYIVYTIKLTDSLSDEIQTRRRYSDFESLRKILTRIFPLVVIPPIPPKNYFSLSVINGIVGSTANVNGSTISNGLSSVSGSDSPPASGPSYSYINSNYLNKSRLIEHRKRLLANFLNSCLSIPQIRKLAFFAKFLDPTSNWSDEVSLITSQLPKSVFQSNPENGLNTDPIYASLPIPSSNHAMSIPFSNSLAGKIFGPKRAHRGTNNKTVIDSQVSTQASLTSVETSDLLVATNDSEMLSNNSSGSTYENSVVNKSHLDEINKRIVTNYIGLTNDYIELGTFLNSFSMVLADTAQAGYPAGTSSVDIKLDLIYDKIGLAFDNSLSAMNHLISELETKFSEPLGEAVKYTSVFESTKKFKAKKLKQSKAIELELSEKKKDLADSLRAEQEMYKIEKGIQSQSLNKTSAYSLGTSQQSIVTEKPSSRTRFLPSIVSMKKLTKYVSDIMDQNPEVTRKQRIVQLQERIGVLEKCQKIMMQDISYITDELCKNAEKFRKSELKSMFQILLNYNRIFITWAKRNAEVWEEARDEISKLPS